jgi:hypothetical protein
MLNLKDNLTEIIKKIKCYYSHRIEKYVTVRDYALIVKTKCVNKELQELRNIIFLLKAYELCDVSGIDTKVEKLISMIDNNNCLNDDCIKQTVIEKLIDDAINAITIRTTGDLDELLADVVKTVGDDEWIISLKHGDWAEFVDADLAADLDTESCSPADRLRWRLNALGQLQIQGCIKYANNGAVVLPAIFDTAFTFTSTKNYSVVAPVSAIAQGVIRATFATATSNVLLDIPTTYVGGTEIYINLVVDPN